jgi:hypothetical protein
MKVLVDVMPTRCAGGRPHGGATRMHGSRLMGAVFVVAIALAIHLGPIAHGYKW